MTLIASIARTLKLAATRRAERIALTDLLRMDAARLDDLGINRQDVIEALKAPPPAGPRLEARRAARAIGPIAQTHA